MEGSEAAIFGAGVGDLRFGVEFVDADGVVREGPLAECWAFRFEDALPVRTFRWSRGQGHFPGWWWSATTGRHVGFESWLERDHAMLLDFDPAVAGFSSQPFWLSWRDGSRRRRHVPDFFVRRFDGVGVVVDVRAEDRVDAKTAEVFAVTESACRSVGWAFARAGAVPEVLVVNVRWLARYRHPRCRKEETIEALLSVFAEPTPLMAGAAEVGEPLGVLPVLFHLMWARMLTADLAAELLGPGTVVRVGVER